MVTNTLGVYNPIFYAQEALQLLQESLGMANRVHRGFEEERRSFDQGETINIRRPSEFIVQDAPSSSQNISTETIPLVLNKWKEVKMELTDKELSFTTDRIINDHIQPAVFALANYIDQQLALEYKNIPWSYDLASTSAVADITGTRRIMVDNKVPVEDLPNMHYMAGPAFEEGLLNLTAFSQHQGAGDTGVNTQTGASLGRKYQLNMFTNQNVQTHVKGTSDQTALVVHDTTAAGLTTINLDAVSLTGTVVPGDSFSIAGHTQRYAITNTVTAGTNEFTAVTFTPKLEAEATDGDVVTLRLDNHESNLAFHKNAFALALAPLPQHSNANFPGAKISTVSDPKSQTSIRARMWYDPDNSKVKVAFDVLFGIKTLNPNLAVVGAG